MKWYHIHVFRWNGEIYFGLFTTAKEKVCRCGQKRLKWSDL